MESDLRFATCGAILATVLLTAFAVAGGAQEVDSESPSPSAGTSQQPCSAPAYRQFDFWLGKWQVEKPDGTVAGTNEVRKILDGCVLQERWRGAQGLRGTSFNTYYGGRWHQTWVDASGGLLLLDGGLEGTSMRLAGTMASREDARVEVLHEIRWTPLGDGRVRQLWRASRNGGRSWTVVFDGSYVPVGKETSKAAE